MVYTYEQALVLFRDTVNTKFPPNNRRTLQHIREVTMRGGHQGGEWGSHFEGRGRYRHRNGNYGRLNFGRGSYGRGNYQEMGRGERHNNWVSKARSDSKIITLEDGEKIRYHVSFSYPNQFYNRIRYEDKERIREERK